MPKIGVGKKDRQAFGIFIKNVVPYSHRTYDPKTGLWNISYEYFTIVMAWKRYHA